MKKRKIIASIKNISKEMCNVYIRSDLTVTFNPCEISCKN